MSAPDGPANRPTGQGALAGKALRLAATPEELERFHRDFFLPLVWRVTWKHGLPKEDARDIVQDAFVLAITKLRSDGNVRAWLTQVVDNLVANHVRKGARRSSLAARWAIHCSNESPQPEQSDE
jgi:DNA-directed RNA polymerase specialized sigma24 family protein